MDIPLAYGSLCSAGRNQYEKSTLFAYLQNELSFNNSIINNLGLRCSAVRKPEWNALYFLWVFLLVSVFVCMHVSLFVGSTLLSSSFRRECVSVCVLLHSPQGLFQLRAKNTEKLWKSFYVLLSEMILRKKILFIQTSTSRRALTQLPSSLPLSLHPSIHPLFLGLHPCCVWRYCHGQIAWAW